MARKTRTKTKARKRVKGKVRLTQRARIVEKNDATRVARLDTISYSKTPMPRTNGAVFKVKIKRK